jgi:MinD-like ATPase involved in chromosome partitioning or flagellar assembly
MAQIASIHSFRRGTGKTTIAASLAALLAMDEQRVCFIDTDLKTPSAHLLFGLSDQAIVYSLEDYLQGKCKIKEAVYDLSPNLNLVGRGHIFLVPAKAITKSEEAAHLLHSNYRPDLLGEGCRTLIEHLNLDVIIFDVHAGITEETIIPTAICHTLYIILRPDQQDYQGTAIMIDVARRLNVPDVRLIVNEVPPSMNPTEVQAEVERVYQSQVVAILPHTEEMMLLASRGVFALHYPNHPLTNKVRKIAAELAV